MYGAYGIYNHLDNQLRLKASDTLEKNTIENRYYFPRDTVDGSEILHRLISSLSHYSQGAKHPRWLFGISSINSTTQNHEGNNWETSTLQGTNISHLRKRKIIDSKTADW